MAEAKWLFGIVLADLREEYHFGDPIDLQIIFGM